MRRRAVALQAGVVRATVRRGGPAFGSGGRLLAVVLVLAALPALPGRAQTMTKSQFEMTELTGTVVPGGVECPLIQLDSGERYALQGLAPGQAEIGARLTVRGVMARMSTCQQGQAFQVIELVD